MSLKAKIGWMLLVLLTGPIAFSQSARDTVVELSALVQESPPRITLNWPPNTQSAPNQKVYRRLKGQSLWNEIATLSNSAITLEDNNVVPGVNYEYFVSRTSVGVGQVAGYLSAGIRLPEVGSRGKVILLVDDTISAPLANELSRFISDLIGDGWSVLRADVPRNGSVTAVKATIRAFYDLDPGNTKAVVLFGHVPVPYSGDRNPDGHPDHSGAWPADVYYGDMDGIWTDSVVNDSTPGRVENRNIPGDGKFDQSVVPSDVELQVGRIDLANMNGVSNGLSETELLRQYLNRDHDFRNAQGAFANVARRGLIDDEFGYFSGEAFAATGWRNFTACCGSAPGTVVEADWFFTLQTQSFLFAYACGGGAFTGGGGVGPSSDFAAKKSLAVFNILLGSYFGDWDNPDNLLRAPLAGRADSLGLVSFWAGRPHWYVHHMAMGETVGYGARLTQNNTGALNSGYVANTFARGTHIGLMGDPTLRLHPVLAPTNVVTTADSSTLTLRWTASTDVNIEGYAIYRATASAGSFVRLESSPILATEYIDQTVAPGITYSYMVQAIKLETSAGGTYLNNSQGAFGSGRLATLIPREISVSGNGQQILDGDSTISAANGSDFGGVEIDGQAITRSFTITNVGDTDLHLPGTPVVQLSGTAAADFNVVSQPPGTLQPGGTATFQIVFSSSNLGARPATVTIASDDADENLFEFAIGGTGLAQSTLTITPDAGPNGSISPNTPVTVAHGTGITLTAVPTNGFLVDQWLVNGALVQTGGESFTIASVTTDSDVRVTFKAAPPPTYTVTAIAGANGTISPGTPQIVVSDSSVSFTASPANGFLVDQWLFNGILAQSGGESFAIAKVTADAEVRVTFRPAPPPTYNVTPTADANGIISPDTPQNVTSGTDVSFTATPASGFLVDQWLLNGTLVQTGGVSFTLANVSADAAVRVTFKTVPLQTYTVTPTADANGIISPDTPQIVSSGTDVSFTAAPLNGFLVDQWLLNDTLAQRGGENFTLSNVNADATVRVTFKPAPPLTYTVTPVADANGIITPDTPQSIISGSSVSFIATPASGFLVDQWLLNGALAQSGGGAFILTNVTADEEVRVTFKTISASGFVPQNAGYTGLVSSSDVKKYTYGRVRLQTTRSGAVTGNALIDGHRYRFRGNLDDEGRLSRKLVLELNGKSYEHQLELQMMQDASGFGGAFKRDSGTIERSIFGERNASGTRTAPVSHAGRYTGIVGNLAQSALGSPVRGFLSMRISSSGAARIVGYLPDGTLCGMGSHLSVNDKIAVVAGLYPRMRGYLFGQTTIAANGETRDWAGDLGWLKPVGTAGIYGNGVLDEGETVVLDGALYRPPANEFRVLPAFDASIGAASVVLSGGNPPAGAEPISITMTTKNKVIVTQSNTHKLDIHINELTGCFHGSLLDAAGKRRTLRGAFVDGATGAQRGEGFFMSKIETGRILIEPAQ